MTRRRVSELTAILTAGDVGSVVARMLKRPIHIQLRLAMSMNSFFTAYSCRIVCAIWRCTGANVM